jgi:serine protease inhibitor
VRFTSCVLSPTTYPFLPLLVPFISFRLSERNEEVNNHKSKVQELLNNAAIRYLQNKTSENYMVASANVAILQCLAKLINVPKHESPKDISEDDNSIHEAIKFARSFLEGKSDLLGNEITILHNIWLRNGLKLNRKVQAVIAKYYNCEIKILPIANNNVNASKLKKKLQKLDRSRRFTEEFRKAVFYNICPQDILLTSGFYVEMAWREPFIENLTTKGTFHISEAERIEVEMMVQRSGLACVTCDNMINATVLQLPLTAHNMCMLVYLPHDKTKGLEDISKNLTPEDFEMLVTQLTQSKPKPVYVTLPKFSLKQSGIMPATFSETEDTLESDTNLAPGCKIFQTSTLTISEYGLNTSKTGQSEATMTGPAVHDGIKWTHFKATSPFLFMLVDTEYQLIFLVGKVARPGELKEVKSIIKKNRNWCCI